ncbi:Sodium/hydrogen exchanger 9B2 like protein [Argiope bruennichi]|uniref:Sodium/hydrogen exchanger 9B2 like protein n=1 Tax=Argiope bruennichi TaxID=94029 RepID=A0A8T0E2H2_ARGBR|nr:Sodium/hydrogen exchanger 9B2 like protein [Argiope bruennichi]
MPDDTLHGFDSFSPCPDDERRPILSSSKMSVESVESASPIKTTKREALVTSISTCPPVTPLTTICALILLVALIYGTLWGLTGSMALPGGPIFGLFALVVVCYLGGQFMRILKLPTLVGMMVFGFVLRNVPHINVAKDIPEEWAGNIRNMALILILLRAGLEVDADVLKNNKSTCSKLIFIPFIAEFIAAGISAHYLLYMPWIWSFLMASMLAAVSPAVVLPVMLKLQKKGIGVTNGVPTMVIAVAGIDDVLALSAFEVLLGITFATGTLGWTIAQGPLEMIAGIIYGILLGVIAWYIPNPDEKSTSVFRFLILCFGGMCVLFGSQALNWGAAGALGCICLPFVAAIRWKQKDWDDDNNPVGDALAFVWRIIEPFLFGLIGSEIRIDYLQPNIVGLGLATMFIGIAARMLVAFASAFSAGLTLKEQIFVTFAGLPKATVQAAIGPVALSLAKKLQLGPEIEEFGIMILTTAVLSILIAAPLGATSIALLAPRLLERDVNSSIREKPKPDIPDTHVPMYDSQNSYHSYGTKDDGKLPSISNETSNNIYSIEKL